MNIFHRFNCNGSQHPSYEKSLMYDFASHETKVTNKLSQETFMQLVHDFAHVMSHIDLIVFKHGMIET